MLIGLTGTLGSGKGTVVNYLVQKGFKTFAVSDTFLAGEALKRGLPADRDTRRNIANEFRAQGPTKLMEAVFELAREAVEKGENVIIEPQHTVAEVEFIKSKGGVELAVDAPLEIRYERIKARKSAKDAVTFEQFKSAQELELSQADPNRNNVAAAIREADFHLTNDDGLETLYRQIDEVLAKLPQRV
jgi:dephospho-CoA kinase